MDPSGASLITPTGTQEGSRGTGVIPITLKTPTEVSEPILTIQRARKSRLTVVSIAPYYRQAVVGQRVKVLLKFFKNKQMVIPARPKQVRTTSGTILMSSKQVHTTSGTILTSLKQVPATSRSSQNVSDRRNISRGEHPRTRNI